MKQKSLIKNSIKILLITLVLGLNISMVATENMAFAAEGTTKCGTSGWTEDSQDKTKCTSTDTNAKCSDLEGGYMQVSVDETKIVCKVQPIIDEEDQKAIKAQLKGILSIQKFLDLLIWPIVTIIGGLLDNSLLFGSGMAERIREIWIPIRNIVNILFVLGLVGVAIYNILGIGEENGSYSIKTILPKIIIGIVAVNFSYIGMKVFLDAVNTLTTSIFSLPSQVNIGLSNIVDGNSPKDAGVIKRYCLATQGKPPNATISEDDLKKERKLLIYKTTAAKYITDPSGIQQLSTAVTFQEVQGYIHTYADKKEDTFNKEITGSLNNEICDGTKLTTRGKLYLQEFGSRNAALAMALNMSGLVYYQDVNAQSLIEGKISAMLISTIFSLLMYLIYAASFIALFIVLLARLVVLWISIVASPIILIGMAIPTVKEKGGFGELIDKFVQEAIAPIGIAFAMTVGWIMLRAMQSISPISSDITLQFDPTKGIPVVGLNTLQDLMVAVGTLGVIWLAVFTAASKSVAAPVTEMIKGGLLTAGKFIGNLPLRHLNLIPVQVGEKGEEKKYTFSQVGEFFHELGREDYNKKRKLVSDLLPGRAHSDLRVLGEKSVTKTKEDAYAILRQNQDKLRKGGDETTKAIREFKVRNDRVYNEIVRDHPDVKKELDTITTSGDQAEIDKALKRLAELPRITGAVMPTSPGTATPPTAPKSPQSITPDTSLGGQTIKDQHPNDPNAATTATTELRTKIIALTTAIESKDKSRITLALQGLKQGTKLPTKAEVEVYLGTAEYKKLSDALGSDTKVQTALTPVIPGTPGAPAASASGGQVSAHNTPSAQPQPTPSPSPAAPPSTPPPPSAH